MSRTPAKRPSGGTAQAPEQRHSAALGAGVRPLPAGGIFKSAAVEVLRRERRLMPTGEICRLALEWDLLNCTGKTPEATMASALYGDIKRKDSQSLFIRPQEGLFGLREWVDRGYLVPPSANPPPAAAPKRAARSGGGGAGGLRGKHKRARRGRGADEEEDDRSLEEEEEEEDEGAESGSTNPWGTPGGSVPHAYSGSGAPPPAAGLLMLGDVATSPLRKLLSQCPMFFAGGALPDPAQHAAQLGAAVAAGPVAPHGAHAGLGAPPGEAGGGSEAARRHLQMEPEAPESAAAAADCLTAPPLYMALQTPLGPVPRGSGDDGDSASRRGSLFSPQCFSAFSPFPGISALQATPAALRGLLPHTSQHTVLSSDVTEPPSRPTALAPAAPILLRGEQPPPPAPWVLVPQPPSSARHRASRQERLHMSASRASEGTSLCRGAAPQQHTPVGESVGADGVDVFPGADELFGLGGDPFFASLPGQEVFQPPVPLGQAAVGTPAGDWTSSSVFHKIAELEAKVAGVEARWGPAHPQTGRAHLLLYHACRHHHVASAHREKGEAALARACAILKEAKQQGGGQMSGSDEADEAALLSGLHRAAGLSSSGRDGGAS